MFNKGIIVRTNGIYFVTLLTVLGCSESTTPNDVVENYTTNVSSANNIRDINYSEYLSKRAQGRVVEGLQRVSPTLADFEFSISVNDKPLELKNKTFKVSSNTNKEKMFQVFLKMLKTEATPCDTDGFETTIDGSSATLTCTEVNYTDEYGEVWKEYKRSFLLVNENGWRIDKIKSAFTHDRGTTKSTTFE